MSHQEINTFTITIKQITTVINKLNYMTSFPERSAEFINIIICLLSIIDIL